MLKGENESREKWEKRSLRADNPTPSEPGKGLKGLLRKGREARLKRTCSFSRGGKDHNRTQTLRDGWERKEREAEKEESLAATQKTDQGARRRGGISLTTKNSVNTCGGRESQKREKSNRSRSARLGGRKSVGSQKKM